MADILQKIKTCRDFLCGECEYDELRRAKGETVCMQKLLDDAADALERKKGEWIPVTERLPKDGDVLAYLKYANNSRITAANYYKGTWQDCVMGRLYLTEEGFVTHWMPLPEPPKEET